MSYTRRSEQSWLRNPSLLLCFRTAATTLTPPVTFEVVKHYSLEDKQLWLDSVRLGRREYAIIYLFSQDLK